MKKFVLLLMAALALPVMAQMTSTKAEAMRLQNSDKATIEQGMINPLKAYNGVLTPANMDRATQTLVWDFEDDADFEGWMSLDNDGDGYGWEVDSYYSYNGGTYSLCSRSFYGSALDPDNWLISPEVPLGGMLSFWAMNYSSYWPDQFMVYVCIGTPETIDDFIPVSDMIAPPGDWTEYTVDLAEYTGATGCFAIRHYDSYNQFRVYLDYITLTAPAAAVPEDLFVDPDNESAEVTWNDAENVAWNLRYREYVEQPEFDGYFWDFENNTDLGDWTSLDQDGDSYGWFLWDPESLGYDPGDGVRLFGTKCATSASYNAYGALTPDDWLVSPEVTLKSNFSFWAAGQDPSYAGEVFAVYVSVGDRDWVKISDDITATSPIQEYTFDLSEYEGMTGRVAIRHYNISDMFRLNVDNILIGTMPEPVEEPEWIYVEDVTSPYIIEGLTPETTYEVQVQGVNDEGNTSAWTESFVFTTTQKTSIQEISTEVKGDNRYYNMMGQEVDGNNLPAGIYIHNGKKILVK